MTIVVHISESGHVTKQDLWALPQSKLFPQILSGSSSLN